MLVIRLIEPHEKFKTKHVLPNFKIFEKIKQVSSTKLTNWYKNISRWKTNKFFHRLFFSRCEPKSLKNIAPEPQSIFSKHEKLFIWKKLTKSKTSGLSFSSNKRDLVFLRHLVKKSPNPGLRLCSRKTQSSKKRLSSIH